MTCKSCGAVLEGTTTWGVGLCYQCHLIKKAPPNPDPSSDQPTAQLCIHCHRGPQRRKQLCHRCYSIPEVRKSIPTRPRPIRGKMCRHCKTHSVNRARGLCWSCYYQLEIRDLYTSTTYTDRNGRTKVYNAGFDPYKGFVPVTPWATAARPGTEEKICVLEDRVAAGEYLFHPLDPLIDLS